MDAFMLDGEHVGLGKCSPSDMRQTNRK